MSPRGAMTTTDPIVPSTAISMEHVSHKFGDNLVLDDVSLHVKEGEFLSVVGPSGCGKTTLLNILAGLTPPQEGRVSIRDAAPEIGRRDVSYMLARDALFPWRTAVENVELGILFRNVSRIERRQTARSMLREVGLTGFEDSYPKALSHGMRQRVAIARTFVPDAPVLLMDEPFGALDALTRLQLQDLLLSMSGLTGPRTVVFITHDLAEAVSISDRVVVMSSRPGRILESVPIDLPRPRSSRLLQGDARFHETVASLWRILQTGY